MSKPFISVRKKIIKNYPLIYRVKVNNVIYCRDTTKISGCLRRITYHLCYVVTSDDGLINETQIELCLYF